jgi:hypothetical protein
MPHGTGDIHTWVGLRTTIPCAVDLEDYMCGGLIPLTISSPPHEPSPPLLCLVPFFPVGHLPSTGTHLLHIPTGLSSSGRHPPSQPPPNLIWRCPPAALPRRGIPGTVCPPLRPRADAPHLLLLLQAQPGPGKPVPAGGRCGCRSRGRARRRRSWSW